jgi:hypothetical protein
LEHIKGPISDGPCPQNPHACFPWHMFAQYDWGPQGISIKCIEGKCPSPESTLVLGIHRAQSPSPTVSATPVPTSSFSWLFSSLCSATPGSVKVACPLLVVSGTSIASGISGMEVDSEDDAIQDEDYFPEINELPRLDSDELENWQDCIRFGKMGNFRLEAPTVEAASTLFIHLLKSLITGLPANQYHPEPSSSSPHIDCQISDPEALLNYAPRPFFM